jgi:hypothetical protein
VNSATLAPSRAELARVLAVRLVEDSLHRLVPNAMVLGDWTQVTPFWYYQYAYGIRSDVRFYYWVNNWKAIGLEEQRFGRPLYLTRKVPEMLGQKHLGMTGPIIHWAGSAQIEAEPDMQPLAAKFRDRMELLGYRQHLLETNGWLASRPYIVQLSLWWRASQPPSQNYSISLRLINAEGRQVAQTDSLHPVLGLYPTSLWDAGEIVEDYYELRADPGDRSLAYHIEILVYWKDQTGQLHNLQMGDSEDDHLALPAQTVKP